MEFVELSADQIAELETSGRSSYAVEAMTAFRDSGVAGADMTNSFPGRKLSNVANALKRLTQRAEYADVKVLFGKRDGEEFLALVRSGS